MTVELIGDRALVARLDAMPGRIRDGLARAVVRLDLELQRKVQAEKLTGRVPTMKAGALRWRIGGNDDVANHTSGRARSWLAQSKNDKSPKFTISGHTIFRRRAAHPPAPERSFLRSALAELGPAIEQGMREALAEAIR
jgi:hypothetical protein